MILKTFGGARPVTMRLPASYDVSPTILRPLILFAHSYTSSGTAGIAEMFGTFAAVTDNAAFPNGAFLLAPDGTVDGGADRFWNASTACCDEGALAPDDDAYLSGLIEAAITAGYPIDTTRIFVIGRSNGGFMANRLACLHSSRVTAIVDVHGAGPNGTDYTPGPVACSPGNRVSILHLHGSLDTTVPYNGGVVTAVSGMAAAPSAASTVSGWATRNGCTGSLTNYGSTLDLDSAVGGSEAQPASYSCPSNGAAELWTLTGSTHNITYTSTFQTQVLTWLQAHPR